MTSKTISLSDQQLEELGRELDELRRRVVDDLGADDRE